MTPSNRRRFSFRTPLMAAAALLGAAALALSPTAAFAAGWGTLSTAKVNSSVTATAWTQLGSGFKTATGVTYRYCVTVKGKGKLNLQPTAFGTVVTVDSSSYVTRCTKSFKGAANTFKPMALRIGSGNVTIGTVTVQRYYTGSVPV
ncbi:hypothetical protein BJ978_000548 [Agromyces terreus]|uniref:Uncharacterized protein n=1 Tax=Agromyces terreus TaxID=424795 RepID=A0A9X2H2X4_9MICO|nr:hypothetical protein [Agromyces terreus]MCP2369872.1 hypothetical protein [Agromyces terreus]